MSKQRILVFSGFLGSGKTTTMIETAKYLADQGIKVALVTNDLGSHLVDTNLARIQNVPVAEIPNGCFCHDIPNLVATIDRLSAEAHPDIVFAEPVGSCVDLVRNVYKELNQNFAERYELAPFTAVIDPVRYQSIYMGIGENLFNEPVTYMYQKQLEEAEVLLLNKIDCIDEAAQQAILTSLHEKFPQATVVPIASANQTNYANWTKTFMQGQKSRIIELDIDWDHVLQAENTMGWYNKRVEVVGDEPIDTNRFSKALLEKICHAFIERQLEIAHLKMIGEHSGDYVKAALTGTSRKIEFSHKMREQTAAMKVNINIRALILPKDLEKLMDTALAECAVQFGLGVQEQYTQAFDSFDYAPEPVYVP